jgi:hypothetical protein
MYHCEYSDGSTLLYSTIEDTCEALLRLENVVTEPHDVYSEKILAMRRSSIYSKQAPLPWSLDIYLFLKGLRS